MKHLRSHNVGVEQGSSLLFSDFRDGGPMWTGEGPRETVLAVTFNEPFRDPPIVHTGLNMVDMAHETNHRVDLTTRNVTTSGFEIVFRTWGDTRVARARADWLAIGPLDDELDWNVD